MLEALIIDDSRADRGILSLLLSDMEEISDTRMFPSGEKVLTFLDSNAGIDGNTKFLVLCDAQLGVDSGEEILVKTSKLLEYQNRYQVLMSGVIWDKSSWKEQEEIDDVMEKKSDLDIWRSELKQVVNSAVKKLL